MTPMANILINQAKINIASNSPLADGRCKLMLSFSYKGNRLRMDTGERVIPEHFDKSKQRVNRKHPFNLEINSTLDKLCNDLIYNYKVSIAKGIIPSVEELKEAIKPKTKEEFNLEEQDIEYYFSLLNRNQVARGIKKGTTTNFITLKNTILKFEKHTNTKVTLANFDSLLHTKFVEFLIYEIDISPNTLATRNKHIKAFFKFCESDLEIKVNEFYKKIKPKTIEVPKIHLTERELKLIEDTEVGDDLERVKDFFLFACYTGRRYSELASLTHSNITTNERGIRIMTFFEEKKIDKGSVSLALNDSAIRIIDKYKFNPLKNNGKYLLPELTNQTLNKRVKKLGQLARINQSTEKIEYVHGVPQRVIVPKFELITTHTARHTYATLSNERGMPITILQKELNHSRIGQTMVYAKVTSKHQHDVALSVWNKPKIENKKVEKTESQTVDIEEITKLILKANEDELSELSINYLLGEEVIVDLQNKGFSVKESSPIEKLKGLYYTISW
jgi:integrase